MIQTGIKGTNDTSSDEFKAYNVGENLNMKELKGGIACLRIFLIVANRNWVVGAGQSYPKHVGSPLDSADGQWS